MVYLRWRANSLCWIRCIDVCVVSELLIALQSSNLAAYALAPLGSSLSALMSESSELLSA